MPEVVNLREKAIGARFLEAAINKSGKAHAFNGKLLVKVSLTIDDIEVPFIATLHQMAEEYRAEVEPKAIELATAMVVDAGLQEVVQRLAGARRSIGEAFKLLRERAERG